MELVYNENDAFHTALREAKSILGDLRENVAKLGEEIKELDNFKVAEKEEINLSDEFLVGLNERNCNARIDRASELRDRIGNTLEIQHINESEYTDDEKCFYALCDIIEELCAFRRTHDCAIKGDPEYLNN